MRNKVLKSAMNSQSRLDVLELSIDHITTTDQNGQKVFALTDSQGHTYFAKYALIPTGMIDTQPVINGSIKPLLPFANRRQAVYCLKCDGHLAKGKNTVAVIGHTSKAVSVGIILAQRYNLPKIVILTNGKPVTMDPEQEDQVKKLGIAINQKPIIDISDRKSKILKSVKFADKSDQDVDLILVSLGARVNNQLPKQLGAALNKDGFVLVDRDGKTSVDGLYAAGDVTYNENVDKQVYDALGTAIRAADAIDRLLRGVK
jgi:thioredoxin reductase (NADPH)